MFPRKNLIILGYHAIQTPEFLSQVLGVGSPVEDFEQQIRHISQRHPVISMPEFLNWMSGGNAIPDNALMITFDDGYQDLYSIAMPILKKHHIPATVFVTTDVIGTNHSIWTNKLYYLIHQSDIRRLELVFPDFGQRLYPFDSALKLKKSALKLSYHLKQLNPESRDTMLDQLAEKLEVARDLDPGKEFPMLNWDQVRELADNGFTIGSHTVTHPILSRCTEARQFEELAESKQHIERETGRECCVAAYPNGQPADFTHITCQLAKQVGYQAAFTFYHGRVDRDVNQFAIPRHPLFDAPLATFAALIS